MRCLNLAKLAAVSVTAGLLAFSAACTMPLADDTHARGRSNAILKDSPYIQMDDAIHDVLAEVYGKDRMVLVEKPEIEHHRWATTSDENTQAGGRSRVRIEGRPMKGSDGHWYPQIVVKNEFLMEGNPMSPSSTPRDFGRSPWIEGGRNSKLEAKLSNDVNSLLREWRAGGRTDPENRRDGWFKATAGGK